MKDKYDSELYGDLVNTVSAIRTMSLGTGLLVGPLLGQLLTELMGFRLAMDVFFFLMMILFVWDLVDYILSNN